MTAAYKCYDSTLEQVKSVSNNYYLKVLIVYVWEMDVPWAMQKTEKQY